LADLHELWATEVEIGAAGLSKILKRLRFVQLAWRLPVNHQDDPAWRGRQCSNGFLANQVIVLYLKRRLWRQQTRKSRRLPRLRRHALNHDPQSQPRKTA